MNRKFQIFTAIVIAFIVIVLLFQLEFGPYEDGGTRSPTVWDWFELLIIPAAVATGTWYLNYRENIREKDEQKQQKTEEAEQRQQEDLREFLDRFESLLVNHFYMMLDVKHPIRSYAQLRVKNIIHSADIKRKLRILRFLFDARLIDYPLDEQEDKRGLLCGLDLSNENLSDLTLISADLSDADLRGTKFNKTDLSKANLSRVIVKDATFEEAKLVRAILDGLTIALPERDVDREDAVGLYEDTETNSTNQFPTVNFSKAKMHLCSLRQANLPEANFQGALLIKADMEGALLDRALLSSATLNGANLQDASLTGTDLSSTDLVNVNLTRAKMIGADLTNADLTSADFTNADLANSDLTNADLTRVNFTNANLSNVTFSKNAILNGANLQNASLKEFALINAQLVNANLAGAEIEEVDLSGANLTGATLTKTKISETVSLKDAIFLDTVRGEQVVNSLEELQKLMDEEDMLLQLQLEVTQVEDESEFLGEIDL